MSDKQQALKTIFGKLKKLLPLLGSDKKGEVDNALQAINRLLKSAGLDWHDLCTLLISERESLFEMLTHLLAKDPDILVQLGRAGAKFFCSPEAAFADVTIGGHRVTCPLRSPAFSEWLVYQLFVERKKAPTDVALKTALRTLEAYAKFEGARHDVYLRLAESRGKIYVDLCDPEWRAVEIDANGWRITSDPPVRFRRTAGMAALPVPQRGGSIKQLRGFVNLTDAGFVLFVSALLDAFRPSRPHPVLYLAGEEGSAKSTAAKIARSLIDPNNVPLRNLPGTVRDLFVAVHGSHMLVFDNVSEIKSTISDALCQIASGSGFGTRKLYTDAGQFLVSGSRPVILNGLSNAITRSDLADRSVVVPLSPIKSEQRLSEVALLAEFEAAHPQIFGALLDAIVCGVRQLPNVEVERPPRMADFVRWACACEDAFAARGAVLAAFAASARQATEAIIEADPVAIAIGAFMQERRVWSGTVTQLMHLLTTHDRAEAEPTKWRSWPRDPGAFGKRLRKIGATLRKTGVEIHFDQATDRLRTRFVEIRRVEPQQPSRQDRTASGAKPDRSDNASSIQLPALRFKK
jgi:hypothetical protein